MTSTLAPRSLVPSSGSCFQCGQATVTAAVPGTPPARCLGCGSAWFDLETFLAAGRGELRPIDDALLAMAPRSSTPPRTAFRDACHADQGGSCPICDRPLRRAPVRDAGVEVEVCDTHGVGVHGEDVALLRQAAGIQAALREVAVAATCDAPRPHWPSRVVLAAGLGLFVASLFLPAVHVWRDAELPGLVCLVLSPALVPEQPIALLCVMANLLVLAVPVAGRRLRGATALAGSVIAFGGACGGLAFDSTHVRLGYRMWLASLIVVAFGLLVRTPLRMR